MANVCSGDLNEFQITFYLKLNKEVVYIWGFLFDIQYLHLNKTTIIMDKQDKRNKGDTTT